MGVNASFICNKTCLNDNKPRDDIDFTNRETISTE